MSIAFLYLLFVVLPSLDCFLRMVFGFGVFAVIVFAVCYAFNKPEYSEGDRIKGAEFLKNIRIALVIAIVTGFLGCFTPSKEEIYSIAGAYAVTNNAEMKKIPDNFLKAANAYLDKLNKTLEDKDRDNR